METLRVEQLRQSINKCKIQNQVHEYEVTSLMFTKRERLRDNREDNTMVVTEGLQC